MFLPWGAEERGSLKGTHWVQGARRASSRLLEKREMDDQTVLQAVLPVGIAAFVLILVALLYYLNRRRALCARPHKSTSGSFLNPLFRIQQMTGRRYQHTPADAEESVDAMRDPHQPNSTPSGTTTTTTTTNNNDNVDRHFSVRSIMTLPAYSKAASHNERILGRAGERDGMDVIVDMPSEHVEEGRRDQEMETLYQIRLARRQHNAQREERNRQRVEARQRGDVSAIAAIRARARRAQEDQTIAELQGTVQSLRGLRERSVSSVSYGDLGVARHDGTRLRANSNETERTGLLSAAATLAASTPSVSLQHQERGASLESAASSWAPAPRPGHGRGASVGSAHTPAGVDLGAETGPPPEYEPVSWEYGDGEDETASRSEARAQQTPLPDGPPPDYPGSPSPNSPQQGRHPTRGSRGVGGVPQLPSLRLGRLPQIVLEPPSAQRQDDHE